METQKEEINEREGAEIVYGVEHCKRGLEKLLEELGFPKGVMPLKDLVEYGRVRATGFMWMKQKSPSQHFFTATKSLASYDVEVTAYVTKDCMKKMTGVKSKQMMMWVPIVEMTIEDPKSNSIHFKSSIGIGKSFPLTAFMDEDEKHRYLENAQN